MPTEIQGAGGQPGSDKRNLHPKQRSGSDQYHRHYAKGGAAPRQGALDW
jgi:hypothetical protein